MLPEMTTTRSRWGVAIRKSQGQTVEKAFIDLGMSKATAGLTFNRLSKFRLKNNFKEFDSRRGAPQD